MISTFNQQWEKIAQCDGFIAALDQSGGSTPKALEMYGIGSNHYDSDATMFDAVHAMRSRIITSPSFNGDRILAAILFEDTLKRDINGINSADYLWKEKNIVPLIKVDKGLLDECDGVQLMKPMPELNVLLTLAKNKQVFGTKMRSVIKTANDEGINRLVNQQFTVAKQIISAGLVPIIEPEVDIHADDKADIESLLRAALLNELNALTDDQTVMLKLTLPSETNFYHSCINHSNILRVVALSGGYNRNKANQKLTANQGMIASFSRALTEGLRHQLNDSEFNQQLDNSIEDIFLASKT
ncbi:MAG: fructose bisphosphate aldolase [Cellvibrionales bacterium]|nr:fructose bisphosphate aldolase [Cellvibrionales bacterium]|tara:strand:+ start:10339 stop:11235 length:897 start_codon:yes stop_codon:yes gene_type:complete